TAAQLRSPEGSSVDGAGTLFVADTNNDRVRVVGQVGATGPSSATTTLSYDPAHPGDVTTLADPDGHVSTFAYDQYGDLTRASDSLSETVTYGYDAIGRLTSVVSPRGN